MDFLVNYRWILFAHLKKIQRMKSRLCCCNLFPFLYIILVLSSFFRLVLPFLVLFCLIMFHLVLCCLVLSCVVFHFLFAHPVSRESFSSFKSTFLLFPPLLYSNLMLYESVTLQFVPFDYLLSALSFCVEFDWLARHRSYFDYLLPCILNLLTGKLLFKISLN